MTTRRLQAVQAPLTKAARQAAIVELLGSRAVASQTQLGQKALLTWLLAQVWP